MLKEKSLLYFLFTLLYLFSSGSGYDHAIYISVLEIDAKEMKIKVFTDNLQDAVRNHKGDVSFTGDIDFPEANELAVEEYFREKISLKINEKEIDLFIRTITLEGDSYWITLALEAPEKWQSFYLEATYFMELFPDQSNMVKVKKDKPKFYRLTKSDPSCSFTS